jgi:Carboxypeptidase regulatory-like domain
MHSILFALLLLTQQAVNSASVSGQVEDQTAASIASATVILNNLDRNQSFSTTTDENGRFRFLYMPVGSYQLRVERPGFSTATASLTLSVGQSFEIPIQLTVAGITEQVSVQETLPVIELNRTQVAETIIPTEIDELPLNGRNYLDLALLLPAVSKTNTGNNERFAETSAVPGTGISVAGQRNLNNGFIVDGLSANDDAADLAGTFYSQEVIREFQVITAGGIAEFGRASAGVVNIITQSGTNAWHGKLYGFFRNHRLDARHPFATEKSPLTQAQYGATAGGPLQRDRTFLFTNFEREDLNRSGLVTITPANAAILNIPTGAYPTGDNRTSVFARTDFTLGMNHRLTSRYSLYDIFSPNARNVGGLNAVSRGTRVADRDQTIAANDLMNVSANAFNEARFQYTHSRFEAPGNDLVGPAVSISGVANFSASTTSPTARDIDLFEFADNYSIQQKAHFLKAGIDLLYNRVNIVFPGNVYGSYSFSTLANYLIGNYTTFTQAFGKVDWFQTNPNLGWFVQDEWKAGRNLNINAGLRHDVEWLAAGIQTSANNFSPRLGLAYAPGDHKTVIRAGVGQYYDRIPLRAVANALRGAGTDYKTVSLQRSQVEAPVFPSKLASVPRGVLFNLATIDPHIQNGYSVQANLQIERELADGTSASIGYMHVRGIHIIMQRNLNVPTLTAAQDPINLGRPNPNFGNITQYSGQGDSYYDGITVSFQRRSTRWMTARVSYTLAKAIDDTGNAFFSSPQDNFNIRNDRGLSDNDQRHRLTISGETRFEGWQVSPIFTYGSAYPFNIVTGGQTLQTTAARTAGIGRNTGVGFASASLDLRLSRRFDLRDHFKLDVIAESFNTLNRTNRQFPNNTFGTGASPVASFGKATNAADPRQIQFGLKLAF